MKDYTCNDESLDKHLELDKDTAGFFDQESFFINNNIIINRTSKDIKKNNIGYRIIDVCKNYYMSILNGRYGQDEGVGSFTFRDQSVIDYAITCRRGFTLLPNFEIQDLDRIYSDGHCLLQITAPCDSSSKNNLKIPQHSPKPRKWDQQKATNFSENIDIFSKIFNFLHYLPDGIGSKWVKWYWGTYMKNSFYNLRMLPI